MRDDLPGFCNLAGRSQTDPLLNFHEVRQVRTVLPHVAKLKGRPVAELLLHGKVPLLVLRGPQVLICNPQPVSDPKASLGVNGRKTVDVDGCAGSHDRETTVEAEAALPKNSERWIDRELLVRTASLLESGDRVTSADDHTAPTGG